MAGSRLGKMGAAAAAAAAAITGLVAVSATAATVNPGTLRVSPGTTIAGSAGDVFTFTYTAPGKPAAGTVSITVPAGFSIPQDTASGGAGYLSTSSACAQFQITGVAAAAGGASTVTVAVNCAAKLTGTVIYADASAPTTAGAYPFATAFTPSGSQTPISFTTQHSVTVKPAALAKIVLSPATATIIPGGTQSYTVQGFDAYGNSRGDLTAATKFTISPNGSCTGATCTATATGPHTVTGKDGKISGTAALAVSPPAQADLAAAETVSSASPDFGTSVTFTTTVANTSTTTTAAGVTATVAAPSGLISPTITAGTGSYANGTWTIGSLAPGANATLTITGLAGDVADGTQTVTATVTATTSDPNLTNNTASASEASQPAPVGLNVTAGADNTDPVDVSSTSSETWTAAASNAANTAAPPPDGLYTWTCTTSSGEDCPADVAALNSTDSPSITLMDNTLIAGVVYSLTITFTWTDPNYQLVDGGSAISTTVQFTTTNSGGG